MLAGGRRERKKYSEIYIRLRRSGNSEALYLSDAAQR